MMRFAAHFLLFVVAFMGGASSMPLVDAEAEAPTSTVSIDAEALVDMEGPPQDAEASIDAGTALDLDGLTPIAMNEPTMQDQEHVDDTMQYSIDTDEDLKPFLSNLEVNHSLFDKENASELDFHDEASGLKPHAGDKIPKFAQTFPGCYCVYDDVSKTWSCSGAIAMPESVAGDACCCCTLGCHKNNRCTNAQCLAVGIDQAAEIAAEEKRLADLLKGADLLLGGEIPVYKVMIPKGKRCMRSLIVKACQDQGLTPICDHSSYWSSGGRQCWYADVAHGKYLGHHFSLPQHNKAVGIDPNEMAGMCFYAVHGDMVLVNTGTTHTWTNCAASTAIKGLGGKHWTVGQMDAQANGHAWFTMCGKNKPQTVAPKR
jgi:hypothetical protein